MLIIIILVFCSQFQFNGEFEMTDYIRSNEWDVVGNSAKRNVITYPCCPNAPYVDLTFT